MKIDKDFFFRNISFIRPLNDSQVEGLTNMINAFDLDDEDIFRKWLANRMGTSVIESNKTFKPVVEGYYLPESKRVRALYNYYSKHNSAALRTIFPYGLTPPYYYGRGAVTQLTHYWNYEKASQKIFGDNRLVDNPDLVLDPTTDMKIAHRGMREGWFTGRKVSDYLNDNKTDWVGVRRVINGLDKAHIIAGYSARFYTALRYGTKESVGEVIMPLEEVANAEALEGETRINEDGIAHKAIRVYPA